MFRSVVFSLFLMGGILVLSGCGGTPSPGPKPPAGAAELKPLPDPASPGATAPKKSAGAGTKAE